MFKFDKDFRKAYPETVGETDAHFDLDNYKEWLEEELTTARDKLQDLTEVVEGNWKLVGHSYQIADTGDYDGHYEITDGSVSLLSNEDDHESLMLIVNALNMAKCKIYLDDCDSFVANHFQNEFKTATEIIEERIPKLNCPHCNSLNTGSISAKTDLCFDCGKQFAFQCPQAEQPEAEKQLKITCPDCNGTGYEGGTVRLRGGSDCKTCKAFGKIDAPKPTESERVEKLKAALETIKNFDSRKGFGMKQVAAEALNSLKQ